MSVPLKFNVYFLAVSHFRSIPFADVQFDFTEPSFFGEWGDVKIRKKIAHVGYIGNIDKIQV
jgi:hypothetical protein